MFCGPNKCVICRPLHDLRRSALREVSHHHSYDAPEEKRQIIFCLRFPKGSMAITLAALAHKV